MALSRAVFGQRGNLVLGSLIWITRWGWETIGAGLIAAAIHGSAGDGQRPIGAYGLGWVATIAVSFLLYVVLPKPAVTSPAAEPVKAPTAMAV